MPTTRKRFVREVAPASRLTAGRRSKTIRKELGTTVEEEVRARTEQVEVTGTDLPDQQRAEMIEQLEQQMLEAAQALDFERAAALRDRVRRLRGEEPDSVLPGEPSSRKGRKR